MYELPSSVNVKEVLINEEVIDAQQQPLLMYQKEAAEGRS
jgi:ATP-dependent protease Clp ATPase subunit